MQQLKATTAVLVPRRFVRVLLRKLRIPDGHQTRCLMSYPTAEYVM